MQATHARAPHWRLTLALFVCSVFSVTRGLAVEPWQYQIGQHRANQQANLCADKNIALDVARIFEKEGPRPGYAALNDTNKCVITVQSFTPRAVIRRVRIATKDGGYYTVSFVEVETEDGATRYLVTTRKVRE